MIRSLLIANRGEIAVRIMRTAKRLGIRTIAVYSTADHQALHVTTADEAHLLGDPPPSESYLNEARIMEIARDSGAEAIHPGYGFLAENAGFARRCAESGLIFVGPPAQAIDQMGGKGGAREIMQTAGVPVLPGLNSLTSLDSNTLGLLEAIGYPLLLKPEAGGGGKGMKIVAEASELAPALESARREARSAFANDAMMAEKFVRAPRHVEIQVFADSHGNCVSLGERDCSLQRRHQKILEESPAPHFSSGLREQMGAAAVTAARAIGYVNAGTVEFLLDEHQRFYFMEMNTRLQVEHPVTEIVNGVDLVEWQLRVASGESLPPTPVAAGHAIEARIYAEDPHHDFLPASGRLHHLRLPAIAPGTRVDNGIRVRDQIGVFYDPMLMKVIGSGSDRSSAIASLTGALEQLQLGGVKSNRDFVIDMLRNPDFAAGHITTDYLDTRDRSLTIDDDLLRMGLTAVAILETSGPASTADPWDTLVGFRLNQPHRVTLSLVVADETHEVSFSRTANGMQVAIDGHQCNVTHEPPGPDSLTLSIDDIQIHCAYCRYGPNYTLFLPSVTLEIQIPGADLHALREEDGGVAAPMSGRITAILVSAGDAVQKGTPLITMEAMKMEHTIAAPADGTVESILFEVADLVDEGIELLVFAADDSDGDQGS